MDEIKQAIKKHLRSWQDKDGEKVYITLQFKDEAEMYDLLSLVAKDAFIKGIKEEWHNQVLHSTEESLIDEYFADYWKSLTDTLKTEKP